MDRFTALFLLKIFSLIWQKYFAPVATAAVNTAVQNRLTTLINAVKAGNLPDISWAAARTYLTASDGSVLLVHLRPSQAWAATDWAAGIKAKEDQIKALELQLAQIPQPKDNPDHECLDFWNMMHDGPMTGKVMLQSQIDQIRQELDEMKAV